MKLKKTDIIFVKKHELPRPLVVEDENGNCEILELVPSGPKRLGARVGQVSVYVKDIVWRLIRQR